MIVLKIILYAYARGIIASRQMERGGRENVIFMALSADTQLHFTTSADFIASSSEKISGLFRDVLLVCTTLGLIGGEMVAVEGCKLPSKAAKEWSGAKAELKRKQRKRERAVRFLIAKHRQMDAKTEPDPRGRARAPTERNPTGEGQKAQVRVARARGEAG